MSYHLMFFNNEKEMIVSLIFKYYNIVFEPSNTKAVMQQVHEYRHKWSYFNMIIAIGVSSEHFPTPRIVLAHRISYSRGVGRR